MKLYDIIDGYDMAVDGDEICMEERDEMNAAVLAISEEPECQGTEPELIEIGDNQYGVEVM